jgi:hypothetical protein
LLGRERAACSAQAHDASHSRTRRDNKIVPRGFGVSLSGTPLLAEAYCAAPRLSGTSLSGILPLADAWLRGFSLSGTLLLADAPDFSDIWT